MLYPAIDRLGIKRERHKYGFHIFRHTSGSELYEKTKDLKLVQAQLGHSDIETPAKVYVHQDQVVAQTGAEALAEELAGIDWFPNEQENRRWVH